MTDKANNQSLNAMSDNRTLSAIRQDGCDPLESTSALLDATVASYLGAAYADNTRRAYTSDIAHFRAWGGSIPSSSDEVARYLAAHANTLNTRTLRRRVAALAQAHAGQADPTKTTLVARLLRGIVRRHERPPRQAAPLMIADLERICEVMGGGYLTLRDRALLLIGFFAALRRSEIATLDFRDVEQRPGGLLLKIRRSKTDQVGRGRFVFVSARPDALCPAAALRDWAAIVGADGPLFRTSSGQRVSDRTVARVVQRWAVYAGLQGHFSGHSLRAGYATSAALSGTDVTRIARQTGHRSIQALSTYVRPTEDQVCLTPN